jgi:DNA helicase-2/ATP-dependent DNA helicase PcrA
MSGHRTAAVMPDVGSSGHRAPLMTPGQVAERLGSPFAPTTEQAAVIGAGSSPAVVIAGAGSGKTETMAARVVWLVSNGLVAPERILGLTFTRKAAGELQQRIRARLHTLHRRLHPDGEPTGEPTVLTYAAYAGRLVDEYGILVGAEPGARLLTEAARWQVADAAVRRYDGPFTEEPGAVSSVTGYVLDLAGQLADHLVGTDQLAAFTADWLARIEALPPAPRARSADLPTDLKALQKTLRQRAELIPLLERFAEAKRTEGVVDFADQMVLAARLARLGQVSDSERSRYDVVLLDEYQDTGHAQIETLRALFGDGRAVTAVGDPLQSIYSWRGASAGNIGRFAGIFPTAALEPSTVYPLMTSWRNDRSILRAANRIAAELRVAAEPELNPRPGAGDGRVVLTFAETEQQEAHWVAHRLRREWDERVEWTGGAPTVAVLVRKRSVIAGVAQALRDVGLPVEVVDLGGLLTLPEISDVVATLRALVDHNAGGSLARLLTGARWQLGPADLVALQARARELARLVGIALTRQSGAEDRDDDERIDASLVEALDDLGQPGRYSATGYQRLSRLAGELRSLRRRLDLPLPDLIDDIERVLGLDVEVAARPGSNAAGRANLDRFGDEAARFASDRALGAGPSQISAFLAYLKAAENEEYGLKPAVVEVHSDRVQVLTVHGAKGLEWDVVAIAGLQHGGFPSLAKSHDWTRSRALLPAPLRGDRHDLPQVVLAGCQDRGAANQQVKDHHASLTQRYTLEERRLAYVAVTRARKALYASGALWGGGKRPRPASVFLTELRELAEAGLAEVDGWHDHDDAAQNPVLAARTGTPWPIDPLAGRRAAVEAGAALVRAAIQAAEVAGPRPVADRVDARPGRPGGASGPSDGTDARAQVWRRDVDMLLAERDTAAAQSVIEVVMPSHLSASQVVALSADESDLARRLRRPLPQRPAKQARRGTAFHAWLEQRWAADTLLDIDELPGAADEVIDDAELDALKAAFERSEWATRTPAAVEVPFEMTFGSVVVRGRMDAVFTEPDGRFTVVDWKTGAPPTGADAEAKATQLAVYRLAWAALSGLDEQLDRVGAAFCYVGAGITIAPANLLTADQLRELVSGRPTRLSPHR